MADSKSKESRISTFFDGIASEFKKISFPDRKTIIKQTATVTILSIILGVLIALVDTISQYGVNFLTM